MIATYRRPFPLPPRRRDLNQRWQCYLERNIEAKEIPSYVTTEEEKSLEENVEHLGVLANDTEARGAYPEASSRHEDRIEAATAAAAARAGMYASEECVVY